MCSVVSLQVKLSNDKGEQRVTCITVVGGGVVGGVVGGGLTKMMMRDILA